MINKVKDNSRNDQDRYLALIENELALLPSYVKEYQLNSNHSVLTEYQYLTEFRRFFNWLRESGITKAKDNQGISLETLEKLRVTDISLYTDYLKHTVNKQGKTNSPASINRSLNALRSLFHYLTVTAEDENGNPYFEHNVMLKVSSLKTGQTLNARARILENKMYRGKLKHELIDFIVNQYINVCPPHGKPAFLKNKERDVALIAFLFGTACRRSEASNTNLKDLHLQEGMVDFLRKGGAWDSVPIAEWSIPYLEDYLKIRNERYHTSKKDKALFVTLYHGQVKRLTANTINDIVKKYSTAFGKPTTAHKLRHTTASEIFDNEKDQVLVAQQLGQSGTSATALYTHVDQKKQKNAINKIK